MNDNTPVQRDRDITSGLSPLRQGPAGEPPAQPVLKAAALAPMAFIPSSQVGRNVPLTRQLQQIYRNELVQLVTCAVAVGVFMYCWRIMNQAEQEMLQGTRTPPMLVGRTKPMNYSECKKLASECIYNPDFSYPKKELGALIALGLSTFYIARYVTVNFLKYQHKIISPEGLGLAVSAIVTYNLAKTNWEESGSIHSVGLLAGLIATLFCARAFYNNRN